MNKRGLAWVAGLCLVLLTLLPACPAGVFPTWMINIGDDADESASAILQTRDGGFVVAGFVERSEEEDNNAVLMKLGPHGREIWRAEFGDDREDRALAVAQALDGGFVIAGQFGSLADADSDGFLIKTDKTGAQQWIRLFDSGGHDYAASVEATSDGGYIVGVQYDLLDESRAAVVKTGADGAILWEVSAGEGTHVARATVTADGGCALAWWTVAPSQLLGAVHGSVGIAKVAADGSETWRKTHALDALPEIEDIRATADGGFVLAGQHDAFVGDSHVLLWKLSATGDVVWQKTFGRGIRDAARAVRPTRDGGYIVVGCVQPSNEHLDIYLAKTDANGDVLWERAFGGDDYDEGLDVVEARLGFAVVGTGESFDEVKQKDDSEIVVIRTDGRGHSHNGETDLPDPEAESK